MTSSRQTGSITSTYNLSARSLAIVTPRDFLSVGRQMILRVIERRREMYRCREGSHYTGGTHWNPPDGQLREVRQRVFILAGFTFIN